MFAFKMARSARFVAFGCLRTNSRLPANIQQKYCDQGGSKALLTTTCPICFARSVCGPGGNPRKAPTFPHSRQDKLEIMEDEGILHEVKHFPCCLQEKYPCSCP